MIANWKNTAVIIPVYNSADYLQELFQRITNLFPKKSIFAVNDASKDNSADICKKSGVNWISFDTNCGKGAALQAGFQAVIKNSFQYAFSIDSDLQHKPEDFPVFLKKQNETNANMIIGKRIFFKSGMPFSRILSNKITSKIVSFVTKKKICDSQSGFRLYDLNLIKKLKFHSTRYQFETEIILKFAKLGAVIDFVPIETIYNGQESHISKFRDIINFVKIVLYEVTHKLEN